MTVAAVALAVALSATLFGLSLALGALCRDRGEQVVASGSGDGRRCETSFGIFFVSIGMLLSGAVASELHLVLVVATRSSWSTSGEYCQNGGYPRSARQSSLAGRWRIRRFLIFLLASMASRLVSFRRKFSRGLTASIVSVISAPVLSDLPDHRAET
ncbi:MAG: hypothetical protein U0556_17200 [Dehalococcoidia bacterium]